LFKRISRWRFGVAWWLAVLVGLPVLTVVSTLILSGSLESIDPSKLFWDQLRLLLINFLLVNLWEETAWALLNGELYRLGILIAVVVLIAALALLAGRRRLSRAYRLELDANPGGVAHRHANPRHSSRRRTRSHRKPEAHQKRSSHADDTPPASQPDGCPLRAAAATIDAELGNAPRPWRQAGD
jgi:hypothetical protein